jgi:hypothetical protein
VEEEAGFCLVYIGCLFATDAIVGFDADAGLQHASEADYLEVNTIESTR